ncbi:MAG: outer membrane beta-barrel protein [Sediminibacterium sp.]|nr:outer membrane beta-barrel protein [Sediminibacterium sp.]
MKSFLSIIGVLFFCIQGYCQKHPSQSNRSMGLIIGNVLDAGTGKPLSFASIQLKKMSDTVVSFQVVSDKNGAFECLNLPFGYFKLKATMVGFADLQIDSIYLREERYDFNLGDLKLNISGAASSEVIVYAEKPLIENKDDKIIFNVGESALSGGATTAELLKNMPLINNDPNGKILLKGKEPRILIDDKPTDLNAQQLQDLLESLPGNSIDKIEVMTNPPPQYATETGGVINIVTKKGKIGWVGRVNVSAGTRGESSTYANGSYRNQKLVLNLNGGVGVSTITGNGYSKRENIYKDSTNYFNTQNRYTNFSSRPNFRAQADYEFDKQHILSLTYQLNPNSFDNNATTTYTNINNQQQIYRLSNRNNHSVGGGLNHVLSGSYNIKQKTGPGYLRFIANANLSSSHNNRTFFQQFLFSDKTPTGVDSTQRQLFNTDNNSASLRVDFLRPLKTKQHNFNGGVSVLNTWYHGLVNTLFYRKSDQVFATNDLLSNDFTNEQLVATARAGLSYNFKSKYRLSFGVQAEYTNLQFVFLKGNASDVDNGYWNILPNFTLRKEFSKEMNTTLVYRATIRRPGIGELNPNVDYSDPYNIRFGNPYLEPTLSHNYDWNFSYVKGKYYVNTSLGYNQLTQVFNSIRTLQSGGKTEVTWKNIADRREYEASAWGGYTFTKKFRMNGSAGYIFNRYGASEKLLYKYRDGATFYTSLNYNFTPSNLLTFEGTARYNNFADPQGRSRSNLTVNLGVQRKFFDRRLIVSINIIDPTTQQQFQTFVYGANFNLESFSSSNTRNYRIAISYQLNKVVTKPVKPLLRASSRS